MEGIVAVLPILILCTGLVWLLGLKRLAAGAFSAPVSLFAAGLAFVSVLYGYYLARLQPLEFELTDWAPIPGQQASLLYRVDSWSSLFGGLALAAVLAALLLRTRIILAFPHRKTWTDVYLLALAAVFTHLVFSASAILIVASWICLGLVACAGSVSSAQQPEEREGAYQILWMTCLSGSALVVAAITLRTGSGWWLGDLNAGTVGLPTFLLLLVALVAYSGQFPLHRWATDLGSVPSTFAASSSILTGVASIYLLGRLRAIIDPGANPGFAAILIAIGLISIAYGNVSAWVESDFKRLLRHLTMIELGFAFVAFGLGSPTALAAAALIVLNLVLSGGSVAFHVLELRSRGVAGETSPVSRSPLELLLSLLALASLAGAPPLLGFFARWILYNAAVEKGLGAVASIGFLVSALSIVPAFKWADQLLFSRSDLGWKHSESHSILSLSAVALLQVPGLALGLLPWPALRHVVLPALSATYGFGISLPTSPINGLPTLVQVVTALAVVIPFGIAAKLYPLPLGRLRLSSTERIDQHSRPRERFYEGIRVALEMGAESVHRMFNPEYWLWFLGRTIDWMGTTLHRLSEHVQEQYYFPALLLLGIGVVFVFLD
ncbi:MAG: hypothetical protein M1358_06750 [Chloroflexi bacterium]|nr:hypothetical protein [Chloroflexota bacterium]